MNRYWLSCLLLFSGLVLSCLTTRADTVSIYFPPALEASTGITTSTGGSLAGFTVRAGIFTNTPSQLLANLAGQTSAANIRSTIHASFTQYGSFSMTDASLNDPGQAIFNFADPIAPALRGQDLYLLFYNDASFNNATFTFKHISKTRTTCHYFIKNHSLSNHFY